jgi:hypothetical protein
MNVSFSNDQYEYQFVNNYFLVGHNDYRHKVDMLHLSLRLFDIDFDFLDIPMSNSYLI